MGKKKSRTITIGLMLFAFFFGAGNLIFPASMGQAAGRNVWYAVFGFVLTGVGLPFFGVLAMGYSGCKNLQEITSRVGKRYALFFTVISYIALGPFCCLPRTGTVSYEIAFHPLFPELSSNVVMWCYLAVFFFTAWWLSVNPAKLVDRIGKVLTPALLITILALIVKSLITPMGVPLDPLPAYGTVAVAVSQGAIDGYNTLDAIASFVYAILAIEFIKEDGATTRKEITREVFKAGILSVALLAFVYIFIGYLGATSVQTIGMQETGAPVLSLSAKVLFGFGGGVLLSIIVLLACLSTAIALISGCSAYFQPLFGKFSYKQYVTFFSVISFAIATVGLKTIISMSIPVLMFVYPLIVATIILTLTHEMFHGRRCVWVAVTAFTFVPAIVTGLEAADVYLGDISDLFAKIPLHDLGMDWILFMIVGFVVGLIYKDLVKDGANYSVKSENA